MSGKNGARKCLDICYLPRPLEIINPVKSTKSYLSWRGSCLRRVLRGWRGKRRRRGRKERRRRWRGQREGDLDLGSQKLFFLRVIFMAPESISFESRDFSGMRNETQANFLSGRNDESVNTDACLCLNSSLAWGATTTREEQRLISVVYILIWLQCNGRLRVARPAFMINRAENGDTRGINFAEDGGGITDNGYILLTVVLSR